MHFTKILFSRSLDYSKRIATVLSVTVSGGSAIIAVQFGCLIGEGSDGGDGDGNERALEEEGGCGGARCDTPAAKNINSNPVQENDDETRKSVCGHRGGELSVRIPRGAC